MLDELHNIRCVTPGNGPTELVIDWDDDTRTTVDLAGVIARLKAFAPLAEPALFRKARVIDYGAGIEWPGGLDYSADSLRLIGEEQRAMTNAEFRSWQGSLELNVPEAAALLGFSPRTIKSYRADGAIPKAVSVFCRFTLRDPTVFRAHYRPVGKPRRGRPRKSA